MCSPHCPCQIPIWSRVLPTAPPSLFQLDTRFLPTSSPKVKPSSQTRWLGAPDVLRAGSQHSSCAALPSPAEPLLHSTGGAAEETPECAGLCSGITHYKTSTWTFWWVLAIAENVPHCWKHLLQSEIYF